MVLKFKIGEKLIHIKFLVYETSLLKSKLNCIIYQLFVDHILN